MSLEVLILLRNIICILIVVCACACAYACTCACVCPYEVEYRFVISIKNCVGILVGVALNLFIDFSKIPICTILILPIPENERYFHLLASYSVSFFNALKTIIQVFLA